MKLIICCWWFLGFQLKEVRTHAKRFTAVDLLKSVTLKMSSQTVALTAVCSTHIPRWTVTCSLCTQTPRSSWKQHNYRPSTATAVKLRVHFGFNFINSWTTSAVSTTVWMVETQLCKLRGTSDTFVLYGFCELNLRYDYYYSVWDKIFPDRPQ